MTLTSAERQRFVALLKQMHTSFGPSSIAQFVQDHRLNWDHLQSSHKRLASFLRMLDSNQVGERANAGRLAANYIKEFGLTYDDVIGADLPPEAEWEPEPKANWEPEPEAKQKQPKYEWPTYEKPVDPDEAPWAPQNEKGKPKRKRADEPAYEEALDEAQPASDVATSDELTETQRVIVVVVKLAIRYHTESPRRKVLQRRLNADAGACCECFRSGRVLSLVYRQANTLAECEDCGAWQPTQKACCVRITLSPILTGLALTVTMLAPRRGCYYGCAKRRARISRARRRLAPV